MVNGLSGARVIEVTDRGQFLALAPEWNELVASKNDLPFYRHEFFRVWLDHFAPAARLRVITLRDERGRLAAVLPLMEERGSMYGVPVRQLVSISNVHSNRSDLIAADEGPAGRDIFDHLARQGGWDVLRIADVEEGGAAFHLYHAAAQAGFPAGAWDSHHSPYVPLGNSFDAVLERVSTK